MGRLNYDYNAEKLNVNNPNLITENGKNIAKCCRGEISPTDSNYGNCGFHIKENVNVCDAFFYDYCKIPENLINDPECQKHVSDNIAAFSTDLTELCKDKQFLSNYETTCSCFYPESYYKKIRDTQIAELDVSPGIFDSKRKCISAKCQESHIKDIVDSDTCKPVNINLKQDCNITANVGDDKSSIANTDPTTHPTPDPTGTPPKKKNNLLLYLLIILIVIIGAVMSYMYITWDNAKKTRAFY
jgi:hypothetical protein